MYLVICSNRHERLHPSVFKLIEQVKVYFIKQGQLALQYQQNKYIHEYKLTNIGVSRARNYALEKILQECTDNDIIAFTDDDCVITSDWLNNINHFFKDNPAAEIVFGQTAPYKKNIHNDEICPSTTIGTQKRIVKLGDKHWETAGFSNNMALKAGVLRRIGLFKWWLGPGSIGLGGEDAEFIMRALIHGVKICFEPKIKLFHNKWLCREDLKQQDLLYKIGGLASYGYYFFQGHTYYQPIYQEYVQESFHNILYLLRCLKKSIHTRKAMLQIIHSLSTEIVSFFQGNLIAFIFAHIDKIPQKPRF